jgi:hypothetical protein
MLIGPRYHLNDAARELIASQHLIEHQKDPERPPVWTDGSGNVVFQGAECAARESDSPLHDREVILHLEDAQGQLVPESVWSDDETRAHRERLKDEDVGGYLPFALD